MNDLKDISSYKSRKFVLTASILIIGTLFTWLGEMDYSQWINLAQIILSIYGAANVIEYGAGKYGESKKQKRDQNSDKSSGMFSPEKQAL